MTKHPIVCIVDDDAINRFIFSKTIENQKFSEKILSFENGQLAIEFLIDNILTNHVIPDIIFIDLNMPVMNGWEFIEEYIKIKPKITKKIAIYFVSASINPNDLERANQINVVSGYIVKPFKPEELKQVFIDFHDLNN